MITNIKIVFEGFTYFAGDGYDMNTFGAGYNKICPSIGIKLNSKAMKCAHSGTDLRFIATETIFGN
jgi:hypothetical protein